jgi:hypothetical protein
LPRPTAARAISCSREREGLTKEHRRFVPFCFRAVARSRQYTGTAAPPALRRPSFLPVANKKKKEERSERKEAKRNEEKRSGQEIALSSRAV